ncbi:MAG: alpha-L-fucosidase, partial [Abditibacteriota bacterium]|nr:alpha-L-fucosidase [Abditibacteriota bacterium]
MVYIKMTTLLASLLLFCLAAGTLYAQNPGRAEWMAGRYGMMTHWFVYPDLALPDASQEERTRWFNEQVDRFDTKTLMKQFDESGADWLIFTLAQGNGYFNSANAFLDKEFPGHTPERDLGMEIAKEVKKRGKRFILYLAGQVNGCDKMCSGIEEVFCWKTGEDNSENTAFENRICALFEAYSRKYGRLCDGWWIDGVYGNHHKGKWHFDKWFAAFRAGNPQSAVALSDAGFCKGILTNLCPGNDYFAGETHLIEHGYIRIDPLVGAAEDYGDGKRFYRENGKVRAQGRRPEYF